MVYDRSFPAHMLANIPGFYLIFFLASCSIFCVFTIHTNKNLPNVAPPPTHTHTQKGGGFSLILSQYVCINYGRCTHLIFLFPKGEQAAKEKKKKKQKNKNLFFLRSSCFDLLFFLLFKQMRATKRCFDVHSPYKTSRCFCHVCPEERLVMGKKNKNKRKEKKK